MGMISIASVIMMLVAVESTSAFTSIPHPNKMVMRRPRLISASSLDFTTNNVVEDTESFDGETNSNGRRSFLTKVVQTSSAIVTSNAFLSSSSPSPFLTAALALEGMKLEPFEDTECQFQILVPSTWEKTTQTLPDRRKIVLFIDPTNSGEEKDKTLLFVAYTPVRDDFTTLGSFGSVEQVGQMTILPKGKIAGAEDTDSKMLKAESKKNAYFFDYTSKTVDQPERHFRTIFSLAQGATGGAGSVLVTLTAQTPESRYEEMKSTFDAIMNSYDKLGVKK